MSTRGFIYSLFFLLVLAFQASADHFDLHLLAHKNAPYVYTEGNKITGAAVQVIEKLMARTELSYTLDIVPAKRALMMALKNTHTCIFPVERSQEREAQFLWVSPIVISRHGFFKRIGDESLNIRTLTDAQPYVIGSYLGSGISEYLKNLKFNVDLVTDAESNIFKLKAKRIDLWASDLLSAQYLMVEKREKIAELAMTFFITLKGMACHRSVPKGAIERLNKALKAMYQDGTIEKIQSLYRLDH